MAAAHDSNRRTTGLAVVVTTVVFVALLFVRTTDLWIRRARSLETSEGRVTNLAVILTEYLHEAFSAHDAALRQLAIQNSRIGGSAASDDVWLPVLTSAKAGLTGAGSLTVTDATGTIRHSTLRDIVGQSRRDEYVFRRLAMAASDDLVVGTPYPTLGDPRRFVIPLGRRLTDPDGSFDGMVVTTFLPAEARGFFRTLDVGREGSVWVFHPDGIVVFHEPDGAGDIGKVATTNPLFERARQSREGGVVRSAITTGGPLFISAIRPLAIPPLIVAVSLSRDEVLHDWRNDVIGSVVAFAVLGLLAGVALFTLGRQTAARAEAERRHRIAEERMRFALEAARVGTWEADLTTGATHWSKGLEVIHGMRPGTFAATFEAFMDRVHPEDRQEVRQAIEEATRLHTDSNFLYRTQWPDGSLHWIQGTGRTSYDADGTPRRAAGVGFDVTERRTLEEQYRQSQKMEAVGRLAGGIAHDFNNLLTAITGYSSLLLEDVSATQRIRGDLEEIRKAADSAASLTRQLLAFSRRQILQPQILDLNEVVGRMHALLVRVIGEDIDLDTRLSPSLDRVSADPGQIEQIIMNLAVNARDAMPEGGRLTIESTNVTLDEAYARQHAGSAPGPHVMLAISDTGMGMDAHTRGRLFEPFFTTKGVGKGTGLGLATVYGIVKQSGGSIWVYSEPGQGATFKVYLPVATEQVSPRTVAATPLALEGTETILVAEDQAEVRSVVRAVLTRQGYTVLEAADGHEALRIVREYRGPIHLLLTDVVMPSISGQELGRQLRQSHPTIRVLYTSGYTDDAIVRHGVLEPGVAFIQKPFTPHALLTKIREVLDTPRS